MKNTGSNEAWKANNIYDLAGNCVEWTQEAGSTLDRAGRGGWYILNGADYAASNRQNFTFPNDDSNDIGRYSSNLNNKRIII